PQFSRRDACDSSWLKLARVDEHRPSWPGDWADGGVSLPGVFIGGTFRVRLTKHAQFAASRSILLTSRQSRFRLRGRTNRSVGARGGMGANLSKTFRCENHRTRPGAGQTVFSKKDEFS